ncbi:lysine-sensitive aspartokinase 3 [soil metagenome]
MSPGPVVLKFGGTSVGDAEAIGRLVRHVSEARQHGPAVAVVSALSGVTDRLLQLASAAATGNSAAIEAGVAELQARHELVARQVAADPEGLTTVLARGFAEFRNLLNAVATLRDASPRSRDAIAAYGELLSSRIVAGACSASGLEAAWVDARLALVTNDSFGAAVPLMDETESAVAAHVLPVIAAGEVPVLGGYIGATPDGVTTTLGRGGSDYSAAIFGAALGAREIQIWTDVDGMMTADPRVVPSTHVVPRLSFGEASELAYFGAKVLHPSTILPAVAKAIPVRILNSRRFGGTGTLITGSSPVDGPLAALACKRHITVVDVTSTRMLMAHGFLRRVFEVFERCRAPIDVVSTSEVSISVTVDDDRRLAEIASELSSFADVSVERDMAILCAVGDGLRRDPRLASRILGSLEQFPLRMVSQAASRRNVTVVLQDSVAAAAMIHLHATFFARDAVTQPVHEGVAG